MCLWEWMSRGKAMLLQKQFCRLEVRALRVFSSLISAMHRHPDLFVSASNHYTKATHKFVKTL